MLKKPQNSQSPQRLNKCTDQSIEIVPRGRTPFLMNLEVDGPPFGGCVLMNYRGEFPFGGYMLMNSRGWSPFWGLYVEGSYGTYF